MDDRYVHKNKRYTPIKITDHPRYKDKPNTVKDLLRIKEIVVTMKDVYQHPFGDPEIVNIVRSTKGELVGTKYMYGEPKVIAWYEPDSDVVGVKIISFSMMLRDGQRVSEILKFRADNNDIVNCIFNYPTDGSRHTEWCLAKDGHIIPTYDYIVRALEIL